MHHNLAIELSHDVRQCLQECLDCRSVSLSTVQYCLRQGGRHAQPDHVRLLMDCAEICQTAANFMLRDSSLHPRICAACAEVCRACAESCDRMADDPKMKTCAETCRRCADSCGRMGNHTRRAGAR